MDVTPESCLPPTTGMAETSSSSPRLIAAIQDSRFGSRPERPPMLASYLRLLGDFKGVIDLDAEIPDRRLKLRVAEQ